MLSTILDVSLFRKYAQVLYIDKLMRSLWRQKYLSPSWLSYNKNYRITNVPPLHGFNISKFNNQSDLPLFDI